MRSIIFIRHHIDIDHVIKIQIVINKEQGYLEDKSSITHNISFLKFCFGYLKKI